MKSRFTYLIWLWAIVALLGAMGCEKQRVRVAPKFSSYPPFLAADPAEVDELLSEMSTDQLIGQMLVLRICGEPSSQVYQWARKGTIGGAIMYDIGLKRFLVASDSLRSIAAPLFWQGTEASLLLNNQFNDLPVFPAEATLRVSPAADTLREWLSRIYPAQALASGVHVSFSINVPKDSLSEENCATTVCEELDRIIEFNRRHILSMGHSLRPSLFTTPRDSIRVLDSLLSPYRQLIRQGIGGFWLDPAAVGLPRQPAGYAVKLLREKLDFSGLLAGETTTPAMAEALLIAGADLLVINDDPLPIHQYLRRLVRNGAMSRATLEEKVRRILLAKVWSYQLPEIKAGELQDGLQTTLNKTAPKLPIDRERVLAHFISEDWRVLQHRISEASLSMAHRHRQLPLSGASPRLYRIVQYGGGPAKSFTQFVSRYARVDTAYVLSDARWKTQLRTELDSFQSHYFILVLDKPEGWKPADTAFLSAVARLAKQAPMVVAHFGDEQQLEQLDTSYAIIHAPERTEDTEALMAQLLFGAAAGQGRLSSTLLQRFDYARFGLPKVQRLTYSRPSSVGIAPEKLAGIDAIVNSAIGKKAMPGCQVVVAKSGQIIYSKAFGYHAYDSLQRVRYDDLYDVASLTKVAATTLIAMKAYEEKKIRVNDRLKSHMQLSRRATIRDITIKQLLVHASGLPAGMPVVPYLRYRAVPGLVCKEKDYFCRTKSKPYSLQVADSFYFNQRYINEIWKGVSTTRVSRKKTYRYSDLNFILLQQILERRYKKSLDNLAVAQFYKPLGLRHIAFHPLSNFSPRQIVPTENDTRWRKQLVHGYVHDQTAALFGGVTGSAGLFSNAEDLAVLFQLLLNQGTYGGKTYLKSTTVSYFTSADHGNHRGLGFDKPDEKRQAAHARSAPTLSFGHTGFTGACIWADPKEQLVFVFLSNRIHPDARNRKIFNEKVRERTHQVVYNALNSYRFNMPELD